MVIQNKYDCLLWISTNRVAFFILFFLACPVWGQALEKIDLTPKDYPLWHQLLNPKISENGKWATFLLQYQNAADTLILQNTINKSLTSLPNATKEEFIGNEWLAYKQANKFILYNLECGVTQSIHNVIDYKVSANNKFVITMSVKNPNKKNGKNELRILSLGKKERVTINHVEEYALNGTGDLLAYIIRKNDNWSLNILELNTRYNIKTILSSIGKPLKKIAWGSENNLALFEKDNEGIGNMVNWFNDVTQPKNVKIFNVDNRNDIQKGYVVLDNPSTILKFSKDGEKLFFHIKKRHGLNEIDNHGSRVQVWNTHDKFIYPAYNGNENFFKEPPLMVCWNGDNSIFPLGDDKSSKSILIDSSNYIFSHSLLDDVISYVERRDNTPIDVYNLENGKKDFVMWRTPYMPIKISPTGRYLTYFDETDWWIYDAKTQNHSNITKNVNSIFKNEEYDWSGVVPPYGIAGYTENDHKVLLYDKYDIWEMSTDGAGAKRLTFGREIQKAFKIINTSPSKTPVDGYISPAHSFQEGVILSSKDRYGSRGYFRMSENKDLKPLVEVDGEISWMQKAENVDTYLYTFERFDVSPKLMVLNLNEKLSKELYRSNPHQEKYKWGRSELLTYPISEEADLKGALFYPAGFNPAKYYPMIVFIYEEMSGKLYKYENPTLLTGADINITNLTSRGYFVFCPDIAYTLNDVGNSALKSVEIGINEVLKIAPVEKNKIGLFGHSFGGYETSFIIGNTETFAAAISSAGIHDLKSFYFSVAWLWNLPQSGKFLNGQARFNSPYFKDTYLYEKNSPINYAPNITTPLLTITGNKDTNVNWEQSVKMYNALRLLNKEHILLIYPEEGHDFFGVENQIDMTYKRWQWFDHYLKDQQKHPWMIPYD